MSGATDAEGVNPALALARVGLRRDLIFDRQVFGKRARYLVHDPLSFKNLLFSIEEYRIMTALIGQRSLEENFQRLVGTEVLLESDRDRYYAFVVELHQTGLLKLPITSPQVLFGRYEAKQAARRKGLLGKVSYAKFPLLNPDRFLDRTIWCCGWIFSKLGLALWLALMLLVFWACAGETRDLIPDLGRLFSISNLPIMWVVLVSLKVFHELGHAYACKRFGGVVPEMGIALILMTPYPFVDAGASWLFEHRWQRVVVALAGMWVESFLAGIAALVWIGTPAGLLHDVALNTVLLASLTTILANANPLMRFDGYFVFSDLLGVVNLSKRATDHLKSVTKRVVLGLQTKVIDYPYRERWIYGLYGPASFAYKLFLAFAITGLVLMQWSGPGLALGAIFCWLMIISPLLRLIGFLALAEETRAKRTRALTVGAVGIAVVGLMLLFVPVSMSVIAPGVLEPGVIHSLRAPTNGFVVAEHVRNRSTVGAGEVAFELENSIVDLERVMIAGDLAAELIRFDVVELTDPTRAATHRTRIDLLKRQEQRIDRLIELMHVRSTYKGTVVSTRRSWLGRYVQQGEELGQVHSDLHFIRVVLTDEEVSRSHLEIGSKAEVQWTCDPAHRVNAVVSEIRRSASRQRVPVELTMLAGGEIYARQLSDQTTSADQPYLHVFFRADNVPIEGGATRMTARVRIPARLETIGDWLSRTLHNFYNSWKMS